MLHGWIIRFEAGAYWGRLTGYNYGPTNARHAVLFSSLEDATAVVNALHLPAVVSEEAIGGSDG